MALYKVILEYDGTAFFGMQKQKIVRTVQGEVENALSKLVSEKTTLSFAGRTDTGVHAIGQVISFSINWNHSPNDLLKALNATLPHDAAVSKVVLAPKDFHPRFSANSRTYQYSVICYNHRRVNQERYVWRVWPSLDLNAINQAANLLVGKHDFGAFGTPPKKGNSTEREIKSAMWKQQENQFIFEITANAFLYHMVRRIVFLLVDVGQGKQTATNVEEFLRNPQDRMVPGLAPPNGLSLIAVNY